MWTHRFAILTARAAFTLMLVGGTVYGAGASLLVTLHAAIAGPQEVQRSTDERSLMPESSARRLVASQGGVA